MKTVAIDQFGAAPTLHDLPVPTPGPDDVLVRVQASSANPIDNGIAAGMLKDMLPPELPVILGRDFAGTVARTGANVTGVSIGDRVFGMVPATTGGPVHDGAWAEQIVTSQNTLTKIPDNVETATAGAAGQAALTALALIDALDLSAGQTVLIVGATGGVGSIASQLAAAASATVVAPGRPDDETFLRTHGVSRIIPRDGDVAAAVLDLYPDGVDAIIDNVTFGGSGAYDAALKSGGRVASATNAAGEGSGRTNVATAPSPEALNRIAKHLTDRTLTIPIQHTYDLDQAAEALQQLASGHTQGKVAVRID